ncbi:MAG TPA: TIGR03086 family metal-binding protein [Acidothermaceae bacterium]|nr:TIGR03086 family metal-binding protein [Acidothermaceae bacterium]
MSTQTTNENLAAVLADLERVVAQIKPDQLDDATPCTEFDVAALQRHVLGWLTTFADGFAAPDGRTSSGIDDYELPDNPAAAVRVAASRLTSAVREGAAARPLYLGESSMPGELALGMILWEYLVHGWDLARATGQPWAPPAAAAVESLEFAPGMLSPDYQGEGKAFAPRVPVPDDAPALDRLLALSGRDPNWTAQ